MASKLFQKYYGQLMKILPMDDVNFLGELVEAGLLNDYRRAILRSSKYPVREEKAAYFLDDAIKPAINIGNTEQFNKLLNVMKNCDDDNAVFLADKISTELQASTKGSMGELPVSSGGSTLPDSIKSEQQSVSPENPPVKPHDSIKSEQQPISSDVVNPPVEPHVEKLEKIDIEGKFKVFVSKVRDHCSRDVKVLKALSLQDANTGKGVSYSDELLNEINEASSVDAFFSILAKNPTHCSWINTQVLEKIAPVGKGLHEEYVSAISSKPLVEVLDAIPTLQINKKAYTIIEDKWDQDVNDTTVGRLFDHMSIIASILNIERSSLIVTGISKGTIKLDLAFLTKLSTKKFAILAVVGVAIVHKGLDTFEKVTYNYSQNEGSITWDKDGIQVFSKPPSSKRDKDQK